MYVSVRSRTDLSLVQVDVVLMNNIRQVAA